MGMFPVQNYGRDFNEALTGMGNYLAGQRKADADMKQRDVDNARQIKQDERAGQVADAQIAASTASTAKNVFDLEKSKADEAKTKDLERIMEMVSTHSIVAGKNISAPKKYSEEYLKSFSNGVTEMSNLPNNIIDPGARSRFKADNAAVLKGYSMLDQMPASDQLYTARRGDDPDIAAALTAKERLMPKAQFTKVHSNDQYGEYTLANLEQIGIVSEEGVSKTADWFSIKDKSGNPIYEKDDKGNVISVPDPATGAMIPKKVLVPSTFGHTNDPGAKVKFDLSQLEQAKSQLGLQVLDVYEGMTPEQQQRVQDLNIAKLRASSHPNAVAFMDRWDDKKSKKGVVLPKGAIYINPQTGETTADNQDAPEYKSRSRQEGSSEIFEESQDGGKTWKKVSAGPKFNPRADREGKSDKEFAREARSDIDKSVAEFARRRTAFNKARPAIIASGDPEAIREMNTEYANIEAESAAITTKFETYKREFGRSYTPTASANPSPRPSGILPPAGSGGGQAKAAQTSKTNQATKLPALFAINPQTKQRIVSFDNGKSWQPAK